MASRLHCVALLRLCLAYRISAVLRYLIDWVCAHHAYLLHEQRAACSTTWSLGAMWSDRSHWEKLD